MIFDSIQFMFDDEGLKEKTQNHPLKSINLFVGPNNSGKSLTLKEIGNYPKFDLDGKGRGDNSSITEKFKVIRSMSIERSEETFEKIKDFISKDFRSLVKDEFAKMFIRRKNSDGSNGKREVNSLYFHLDQSALEKLVSDSKINFEIFTGNLSKRASFKMLSKLLNSMPKKEHYNFLDIFPENAVIYYTSMYIKILSRKNTRGMSKNLWDKNIINQSGYILFISIDNISYSILNNDPQKFHFSTNVPCVMIEQFEKVRELIINNFGFRISIDFNELQQEFRVCKDDEFRKYELSLSKESKEYFFRQIPLNQYSDGIKSIIYLLFRIYSSKTSVFTLDEPDVFLHPPYARKLGAILTSHTKEFRSQFFISTHNQNLLQGFIESSDDINVFRLTYKNQKPKVYLFDNKHLKLIMKNASFRYSGIIESIFSDGVILVEGEGDRKIYYQALELYLKNHPEERIDGLNFVYAGGKDKVAEMSNHLSKLGIPFVIILDADAIVRDVIKNILRNIKSVDSENIDSVKNTFIKHLRKQISEKSIESYLRDYGISEFSKDTSNAFETYNNILKRNGIFIVPDGTLEKTIPEIWKEVSDTGAEEKKHRPDEQESEMTQLFKRVLEIENDETKKQKWENLKLEIEGKQNEKKNDPDQKKKNLWMEKAVEYLIQFESEMNLPEEIPAISLIAEVNKKLKEIIDRSNQ